MWKVWVLCYNYSTHVDIVLDRVYTAYVLHIISTIRDYKRTIVEDTHRNTRRGR